MSLKAKLLFALGVALGVPVILLHSPPPGPDVHASCMTTIVLKEGWTFPLNCDAGDFMDSARFPEKLFQKRYVRQNRPLLVLVAAVIGRGIDQINLTKPFPEGYASRSTFKGLLNVYLAYVLLNAAILVLAMLLFMKILEEYQPRHGQTIPLLLSVLLTANGVVKFAFWSPHTVLFNVLMPLLAVYVVGRMLASSRPSDAWVLAMSFLGGLLTLAYGTFVLLLPCMLVACLIRREYEKGTILKMIGIFGAPNLLWSAVLLVLAGEVYNHEIAVWREFVWVADAWRLGPANVVQALGENLRLFLMSFLSAAGSYVLLLLAVAVLSRSFNVRFSQMTSRQKNVLLACAITGFFMTGFLALMGYYAYHLSWNFVPILLVASGGLLLSLYQRLGYVQRFMLHAAVGILVGASCVYMAMKAGPYWSVQPSEDSEIVSLRYLG